MSLIASGVDPGPGADRGREPGKISIALCTYNGEPFIQDQLDSIVNQTRRPDEIVVCDDCSADATLKIVSATAAIHSDIEWKICSNRANLGYVRNFEQAIGACQGEYIFLSDQDDIWLPSKIEVLSEVLEQNKDVLAVFSDADTIDRDGNLRGVSLWEEFSTERYLARHSDHFVCLLRRSVATGATMAIRRRLKPFILPFPRFWVHDEWISLQSSYFGRLLPVKERLVRYRRHGSNAVGLPLPCPEGALVRLRAWMRLVWPPEKGFQVRLRQGQRYDEVLAHLDRHRPDFFDPDKYCRAKDFRDYWALDTARLSVPGKFWYILSNTANGRFLFFHEDWKGAILEFLAMLHRA